MIMFAASPVMWRTPPIPKSIEPYTSSSVTADRSHFGRSHCLVYLMPKGSLVLMLMPSSSAGDSILLLLKGVELSNLRL